MVKTLIQKNASKNKPKQKQTENRKRKISWFKKISLTSQLRPQSLRPEEQHTDRGGPNKPSLSDHLKAEAANLSTTTFSQA